MGNFLTALSFLTVLPVGRKQLNSATSTSLFFPLIGLLIGCLCYGLDWFCSTLLFPEVRAFAVVFFLALISGGLHLDGLADSADGLLSHRPREEMLKIMRDPRVGTMGLLALIFGLGFKFTAVSALTGPDSAVWLISAPAIARSALTAGIVMYPHARPEGGTHSHFYRRGQWGLMALCWIPFILPLMHNPVSGVGALLFFAGLFYLFNRYVILKLGGITGDTLGALCEIMETALFLFGAFALSKGF